MNDVIGFVLLVIGFFLAIVSGTGFGMAKRESDIKPAFFFGGLALILILCGAWLW